MNENGLIQQIIILGGYGFYIELFFAMIVILSRAYKRKYFLLRALICLLVGFPCYYLPALRLGGFDYKYLLIMVLQFFAGLFLYKEKPFPILFSVVGCWALQHVAWNLLGILYDLIPNVTLMPQIGILAIYYSVFLIVYFAAFYLIYMLKIKITYSKRQLLSFLFATIIILTTMFLSQKIGQWSIPTRMYSLLVAFLSLIILIGYPYLSDLVIKERNLANEKINLERMLTLQAEQQQLSKETTDILNMKFHDMKNQIIAMKNMNEEDRIENALELEKSIDIYSDIAKTGNEAVDIVITQKSLLCTSKGIRFTYILDGKALSFMAKSDITSLFGNIIDNAIEGCEKEEGEYRLIKLRMFVQNSLVFIQQENYFHGDIAFDKNGLPLSSKGDFINHGYGTKSIRYIVEKYHGQMSMNHQDDIFSLSLVLPQVQNEE